jgi:tetratricopeptide (TPR) repeat protein
MPAEDSARVFSTGQIVSGRYRIVRFLGRGGMGEVYEGEDLELHEQVALKTLLPRIAADASMIARFKREIQLSRKISHPNVCRVFDLARDPADESSEAAITFLTMEFLAGETLEAILGREGRLSADGAVPLIDQMAEALGAAHRAGIIHRDFKPSNVMLVPNVDGLRAVVTDFGLARRVAPTGETTATLTGKVMGTLDYMAPELLTGDAASVESDVYALGMVAYRILTGTLPFPNDTPLAGAILRAKVPVPSPRSLTPELDPACERAILRALDPDPARRFARTSHFMAAMRGGASSTPAAVSLWARRKMVAAALAAAAILCGGIAWQAWMRSRNGPSAEALNWYRKGAEALGDSTYYKAAKALEEAVRLDPTFALAHARLAEAYNEIDESEKANEQMLRALDPSAHATPRGADRLYVDAIHRTLEGDFPGAIRVYAELGSRVAEREKAAVMVDLGRTRERDDEIPKAMEAYQEAARLDPQDAAAHLRTGMLLGRQNKLAGANAEFDQAESLYQSSANTEGQAEVLYQRGFLASKLRQLPEARAALAKANQLAQAISTEYQEIAATLQLSIVTYQEGDAQRAEQLASVATERARRSGRNYLSARGLTDLGNAQFARGDYARAETNFRDALELARRFHMKRAEARALFSLASLHQSQDAVPETVLKEIQPVLDFFRKAGFRYETIQCLFLIARVQRDLGNYAGALKEFQDQLSVAGEANDRQQMALAEQGIAQVLFFQGDWPRALVHYERHYELATSNADRVGMGNGLVNRAKLLWRLGRYRDAEQRLAQAEELSAKPGSDGRLVAFIAEYRAEMALSRGLFGDAARLGRLAAGMPAASKQLQADANCVAGLALARAGSAREGKGLCVDQSSDNRVAIAEILLRNSEAPAALEQIQPALDEFDRTGRIESSWRAWALAARSRRANHDTASARKASETASARLADLEKSWPAADLAAYLRRADIRSLR